MAAKIKNRNRNPKGPKVVTAFGRYGAEKQYDEHRFHDKRFSLNPENFSENFLPHFRHQVSAPTARLIIGNNGRMLLEEDSKTRMYNYSNGAHPNDPINKTTH